MLACPELGEEVGAARMGAAHIHSAKAWMSTALLTPASLDALAIFRLPRARSRHPKTLHLGYSLLRLISFRNLGAYPKTVDVVLGSGRPMAGVIAEPATAREEAAMP
jgi:hypothetical protein